MAYKLPLNYIGDGSLNYCLIQLSLSINSTFGPYRHQHYLSTFVMNKKQDSLGFFF